MSKKYFLNQHGAGRLHCNCYSLSRRPCVELNCGYCENVERRFADEQKERSSQNGISIRRVGQASRFLKCQSVLILY